MADWLDRPGSWTRVGPGLSVRQPEPATSPPKALAGGRLSTDSATTLFGFGTGALIAPPDDESDWQLLDLDARTLSYQRRSPTTLLEMLANLSPEVSAALFDFLRMCNPGYEVQAFRPGTETVDSSAQAALDAFLGTLDELHGSVDVVIGRLFMGPAMRGAFMAELVLDDAGRAPIDLATPDPASVRFRQRPDPVRRQVWELGQWQGGRFVVLDRPTIRYLPVDPFPGSPYGRPLMAPALFTTLFLLSLLHDFKRVVQQQGYLRLDVAIKLEELVKQIPPTVQIGTKAYVEWVNAYIKEFQAAYAQLEPDDALVHTSDIEVNRPAGTLSADSLRAVDGLVGLLERQAVRGLKTTSLLLGVQQTTTETMANRQWEIHLQRIKSIQHYCETLLGRLFGLALRAQGIQATVQVRFAENRASELLRDAQTERVIIDNAKLKEDYGYLTHEAAAAEVTGHLPPTKTEKDAQAEKYGGAAAPAAPETEPADANDAEAAPGENRGAGVVLPMLVRGSHGTR